MTAKQPHPGAPNSAPAPKLRRKKFNVRLIVTSAGAMLVIATSITAALINRQGASQQPSSVQAAFEGAMQEREAYFERLTRTDRNPIMVRNAGWRQQALAMLALKIKANVERERTKEKSPNFRLSKEAVIHRSIAKTNEMLLLAVQGQGAALHLTDANGRKVELSVSPEELAAIALNKLEALDLAYNLQYAPDYNLRAIATDVGRYQQTYKLAQQFLLKQQNLIDASEELQKIQLWESERAQGAALGSEIRR